MESVSLILIGVGAVIIAVVLVLRLGLRRSHGEKTAMQPRSEKDIRGEEPDFDPLFAIDAKKEEISDSALANMGRIAIAEDEAPPAPVPPSPPPGAGPGKAAHEALRKPAARRLPPRLAEDPHRVVALNVMAREADGFAGSAVRRSLEDTGFEYGEWQIFHYYSSAGDAPPLFSLANMVKPGNFDLERMDELRTAGLSLFMVPAGEEEDIAAFDTMLGTARRLAEELGGEVRDARRSVLTRQAIGHIREQLNEWRCKAQAAHH